MEVSFVDSAAMRLMCMEHIGPYHLIGPVFGRLAELVKEHSLPVQGARWLAIYRDDPERTPEGELRSAACIEIAQELVIPEAAGVVMCDIPGGRYAMFRHRGPCEGLGSAWSSFWGFLEQNGTSFRDGPCLEVYVKCHESGLPPEEWLTELMVPVN